MDEALLASGVVREAETSSGDEVLEPSEGVSIDRIGAVPPERDKDGAVVVPGDPGYHVNLRFAVGVAVPQGLPVVEPEPTIPHRKWFD